MQKIVVNRCYGGFGISIKAVERLLELGVPMPEFVGKGEPEDLQYWVGDSVARDDPRLVQVVEELGEEASGVLAKLRIVTIPDDVKWVIDDYDGMEKVDERHRSW
jgi:hypothetical protein